MPRTSRIVIPGCPHHVTQRGNNRQDVFFVDDDRRMYLSILAEEAAAFGVRVQGYCLMDNHVHLVVTPRTAESLAKGIGRTHWVYTRYINRLHGRSGHLWQNRFYSCALDEMHLWRAMAYVERNPVRAKVVRRAWRYPWSSAAAHCGEKVAASSGGDVLDLDLPWWWAHQTPEAWREVLAAGEDAADLATFRLGAGRGRPLGSDRWLSKLERRVGRRLRPRPVGRPRKEPATNRRQRGQK